MTISKLFKKKLFEIMHKLSLEHWRERKLEEFGSARFFDKSSLPALFLSHEKNHEEFLFIKKSCRSKPF